MHLKNCVLLFAISHLAIAGSCYASSLDLSTCTFANGVKVPDDECAVYRKLEEQKKALADQREKQRLEAVEAEARFQQERQQAAQEMRRKHEAALKRQQEEFEKRQQEYEAQRAIEDREYEQAQRRARAAEAAAKANCGDDFKSPRVGMTIQRAKQCVGRFKMVAQINRADGVVTTYRGNAGTLHVMQGVVIAWSR